MKDLLRLQKLYEDLGADLVTDIFHNFQDDPVQSEFVLKQMLEEKKDDDLMVALKKLEEEHNRNIDKIIKES